MSVTASLKVAVHNSDPLLTLPPHTTHHPHHTLSSPSASPVTLTPVTLSLSVTLTPITLSHHPHTSVTLSHHPYTFPSPSASPITLTLPITLTPSPHSSNTLYMMIYINRRWLMMKEDKVDATYLDNTLMNTLPLVKRLFEKFLVSSWLL